jgi:phosphopantothenoylcysteine decarboxylase/phosphopantothenate--cysteine ligase
VSAGTGVLGGEQNTVHFIRDEGVEDWPPMAKDALAERLVQAISGYFAGMS